MGEGVIEPLLATYGLDDDGWRADPILLGFAIFGIWCGERWMTGAFDTGPIPAIAFFFALRKAARFLGWNGTISGCCFFVFRRGGSNFLRCTTPLIGILTDLAWNGHGYAYFSHTWIHPFAYVLVSFSLADNEAQLFHSQMALTLPC